MTPATSHEPFMMGRNAFPCMSKPMMVTTRVLLVVEDSTGEVVGGANLGSGAISGLGARGFELPAQLEAVLFAGYRLRRRADCTFTFVTELAGRSS